MWGGAQDPGASWVTGASPKAVRWCSLLGKALAGLGTQPGGATKSQPLTLCARCWLPSALGRAGAGLLGENRDAPRSGREGLAVRRARQRGDVTS